MSTEAFNIFPDDADPGGSFHNSTGEWATIHEGNEGVFDLFNDDLFEKFNSGNTNTSMDSSTNSSFPQTQFQEAQRTPRGSKSKGYSPKNTKKLMKLVTRPPPVTPVRDEPPEILETFSDEQLLPSPDPKKAMKKMKRIMKTPLLPTNHSDALSVTSLPSLSSSLKIPRRNKKEKQKLNKLEVENSLLKTEQHTLAVQLDSAQHRCSAIETAFSDQISSLEKQLEDQDNFKDFRMTSQKEEMKLRLGAIQALQSSTVKQEARLRYLKNKMIIMKRESNQKDVHVEELESTIQEMKRSYMKLQKELGANETEVKGLQKELASAMDTIEDLDEVMVQSHSTEKVLRGELERKSEEITMMQEEMHGVKIVCQTKVEDNNGNVEEMEALKRQVEERDEQIEQLEKSMKEMESTLEEERGRREELINSIAESLQRDHTVELERFKSEQEEKESQHRNELENLQAQVQNVQDVESEAKDQISSLTKTISSQESKIKELHREAEMYKAATDNEHTFRTFSTSKKDSIQTSTAVPKQNDTTRKKKQLALDEMLLSSLISPTEPDNSSKIDLEKKVTKLEAECEQLRGWGTKALGAVKQLQAESLLSKKHIASLHKQIETLKSQLLLQQQKEQQKIQPPEPGQATAEKSLANQDNKGLWGLLNLNGATPQPQALDDSSADTGPEKSNESSSSVQLHIQKQQSQIQEYDNLLVEKNERISNMEKTKIELKETIAETESLIQPLRSQITALEENLDQQEEDAECVISTLRQDVANADRERKILESENERRMECLQKEQEDLQRSLEEKEDRIRQLETGIQNGSELTDASSTKLEDKAAETNFHDLPNCLSEVSRSSNYKFTPGEIMEGQREIEELNFSLELLEREKKEKEKASQKEIELLKQELEEARGNKIDDTNSMEALLTMEKIQLEADSSLKLLQSLKDEADNPGEVTSDIFELDNTIALVQSEIKMSLSHIKLKTLGQKQIEKSEIMEMISTMENEFMKKMLQLQHLCEI